MSQDSVFSNTKKKYAIGVEGWFDNPDPAYTTGYWSEGVMVASIEEATWYNSPEKLPAAARKIFETCKFVERRFRKRQGEGNPLKFLQYEILYAMHTAARSSSIFSPHRME